MKRLCVALGVVAVGFAPGVAQGATALIVGGKGRYADLTDEEMSTALGGSFAGYDRVNVPFPGSADFAGSIDGAADNLYDAIYDTPGQKTIGGVSESAPAVNVVLSRLMEDENPPPPDELNAVMYGYPSPILFRIAGVDDPPLPVTPYNILIVKAEYDGIADWPDNSFNLLAVANAMMGARQLHYSGAFADISSVPKQYITETKNSAGGTTTSILIPTEVLPLLKPLADHGLSEKSVDQLDSILRPVIDSAYHRPQPDAAEPAAAELGAAQPDVSGLEGKTDSADTAKSPEHRQRKWTPRLFKLGKGAPAEATPQTTSTTAEGIAGTREPDTAKVAPGRHRLDRTVAATATADSAPSSD